MSGKEYRIFIVEDDPGIAGEIQKQLAAWGFEAQCAENFQKVTEEFTAYRPHLVVLDIMLPFYNGFYWCGEIRKLSRVPVIFLSSAADNMNIITAVGQGGDDFVAKPFDMGILTAKIQALLRRTYDYGAQTETLEHDGAVLNTGDATLRYQGNVVELTKNEYRILKTLLESKGKVVSRERLMERLWETDSYVDENTLSVNVNRLRKKLDGAGLEGFITTKIGMGYLIE